MTARDDFVAYLFDHRVGVVQTVQLTLAKLDAALAEAEDKAMERACKAVCVGCEAGLEPVQGDGELLHFWPNSTDQMSCEAWRVHGEWAEIRVERQKEKL